MLLAFALAMGLYPSVYYDFRALLSEFFNDDRAQLFVVSGAMGVRFDACVILPLWLLEHFSQSNAYLRSFC